LHYSTAGFATYSEYMDMEIYKRNLEEWDAKYGPSSASNTTEFTNPELVHSEVSEIQKRTRRSRRQMAKRHPKPPSESNETDENGYPLRIKWITSNESEANSLMERSYFRDTTFRNTRGQTVNKEPLSHVVTRSKAKIANEKDTREGSRELVIQQPVPTRTIQEDITKMEEEVEKETEQEVELEEPGRVMDKEWIRNYMKDLILPRGGLPKDLLTGVIRVVDGKYYHLDQYLEKAFEGELTPLETNIYHAGNTDPSLLPRPFQTIDYSTSFGKAFFNALAKDPTWTKCRGTGRQPFNTHRLGYILFQRSGKGIRVYVPEGPFTPDDTGIESTVRTTIIAEAHHELVHLGMQKTYLHIAPHCYWPKMFKDCDGAYRYGPCRQESRISTR
jgi:hypothetical protein